MLKYLIFFVANYLNASKLGDSLRAYISQYVEKGTTFDGMDGIKQFYQDKDTLQMFTEMKHDLPYIMAENDLDDE